MTASCHLHHNNDLFDQPHDTQTPPNPPTTLLEMSQAPMWYIRQCFMIIHWHKGPIHQRKELPFVHGVLLLEPLHLLLCLWVQVVETDRWTSTQANSLASPLDTTPSPTLLTLYITQTRHMSFFSISTRSGFMKAYGSKRLEWDTTQKQRAWYMPQDPVQW